MVTSKTPRLDLHGEIAAMGYALVNTFINDNYKLGEKELIIIHGKSANILKNEVDKILNKHPLVKDYKLNSWNIGETIIYLKTVNNS